MKPSKRQVSFISLIFDVKCISKSILFELCLWQKPYRVTTATGDPISSLFGPQAVYQDLSSRHDCPVEIAIARLANQVEGKFLACSRRSNSRARRSDGLPLFFPSYDLTRSQPYERRALLSKRPQQASPEQKSRRCIADVTSRVRLRLLFKLEANQR